jgi:hypothetical protein
MGILAFMLKSGPIGVIIDDLDYLHDTTPYYVLARSAFR